MNVYEKIKIKFPFNPHTAYFIPLKGIHSLVIQLTKNNMLQLAMRKKNQYIRIAYFIHT